MKKHYIPTGFFILLLIGVSIGAAAQPKKDYQVAVYYFTDYHIDSINERRHGKGWTEWDLAKVSRPGFEGHLQPKVPFRGCFDESYPTWGKRN